MHLLGWAVAALCLAGLSRSEGKDWTFFVATNGNNGWSGTAAEGSGPFKTVQRALEAVRQARGDDPDALVTINLGPGRHELPEPLTITTAESGQSAKAGLVLRSASSESPAVLSGGRRINGWERSASNRDIWETTIPAVKEGTWFFRQLFINGERKTRARTPNNGFYRIQGESPQDKPVKLRFADKDIKKAWAESGDVEVIALLAWADIRMQIREVDESARVATLSGDPRPSNKEANARYYLENAPEFLDAPGEWLLDKATGKLRYFAKPGEDLSRAEVIAPVLEQLITLKGNDEQKQPVRNVRLEGITFAHTDYTLGPNGYADTQAAIATRGELAAEYAIDCQIRDCRFEHLAGYAIDLGRGCQNFTIQGNEIADIGGGGIRLGETSHPKMPFEENHSHTLTDNHMHHLGEVFHPAVGVFILQSGTNRVAHNHIHHLYYTGVSLGWNWGYQETPCRENIIEFNHLHHIGQDMLSDMGAVYSLGIQRGTVIRNNLIHDVSAFTYGGWGLYTDEGSSDILLENNVVYRCKNAGFHQHYGRDNIVRNNIFAFNRENQLMRTRPELHISFIFTNNIVYFDSGNLLGSNWSNDNYKMDYNVYWDTRVEGNPDSIKFAGGTFEEWKKRGHDQHSLIADPRFVDPDKFDFSLKEDSPALKLGFRQIDLSKVGVRKPEDRKQDR